METRPKAILFDAVGTLIYPDPPVHQVYFQAGRQFGSKLTLQQVQNRFQQAYRQWGSVAFQDQAAMPTEHLSDGRLDQATEVRRWQEIVSAVFDDVPQARFELFQQLWNHFADPHHWLLYPDVASTWRALHQSNYLLGVASNFDDRLAQICAHQPPLDSCQHVFWSSQLGYSKPDRRFFQAIEQQLGMEPAEILLIGDSFEHDYVGATDAGWHALQIHRNADTEQESHSTCLKSLSDLMDRLVR